MAEPNKDTIYIDIDDEITGIIDKVRSSNGKIVALVLPKRASVFQSIVNMKLLKRGADEAKKRLVLITSEAGLFPLAGAVGIHVAKSLTSRPEIPTAPQADDGREEQVEETADLAALDDAEPEEITPTSSDKSVGELAGLGAGAAAAAARPDDVETVELDNDALKPEAPAAAGAAAASARGKKKQPKAKKDKSLKVPNFNRFRLIFMLAIIVIILIIGLILALTVLPHATIDIQTDASDINANVQLTLDPSASSLDPGTNTVPAKQVSQQKTYSATVNATGQQNTGQKATGNITMTAEECGGDPFQVPQSVLAGTGVSANGQTYITQSDTSFTIYGAKSKGNCYTYPSTGSTQITAQSGGTAYNISSNNASFTVAGRSDVSATGSASGGTDEIQQVVQQSDISNAQSKLNSQSQGNNMKQTLEQQLQQQGYYAIPATYSAGTPSTSDSASVGTVANSVTVTETVTYTMYGAHKSDLQTLLKNNIDGQVNTSQQGILDDGLSNATFSVGNSNTELTMLATAEVGPNINTTNIRQQAAGQKSATIQSQIKSDPNVTGVTVHMSPFYVTKAPKNTNKITVKIAKPTASNASNS